MKLSGSHLKRYRQIAALLWKYGRGDLAHQIGADRGFGAEPDHAERNGHDRKTNGRGAHDPAQLADDLEAMGPTYVKLGQVLAGRPDLLPEPYRKSLERLQDKVKPFSYAEVERIVSEELGARISKAFATFETEPIAAASLGQVHWATLRDGRPVVVKVQRPDIRDRIAEDFEVLGEISKFLDAHTDAGRRYRFAAVIEEFRQTLAHELDYEREAQNLVTLGRNLAEFERIQVPQPIQGYCTRKVLTMERVEGHKLTTVSPVALIELDRGALVEEVFRAYLKQVLVDGTFHADPHPGNVFLTDDGRIALLDLGMVGHTTPDMQESLLKILLAISDGKAEDVAEIAVDISAKTEEFDLAEFTHAIGQFLASRKDQGLVQINVGRSLLEISRTASDHGLLVPSELTLLGKTLMQLDEIGRVLDPSFDPNASVRKNAADIFSKRMLKTATQGNVFTSLMEMRGFLVALPARLNRILDAVSDAKLEVRVRTPDAKIVVNGIEKVANRITMGLVLAALIVGAALLMRVDTTFRLFGYPGLAILCFLLAAAGGCWLVLAIVVQDHKDKQR